MLPTADIIIDLNQMGTIVIYWVLTLLVVFLLGYIVAHAQWTTRMHGPIPKGPRSGGRGGPPVMK